MTVARSLAFRGVRRGAAKLVVSLATVLCVVLPVLVSTSGPAEAAKGGSASDLFVTSPPTPITAAPGAVAKATLTVGNVGHSLLDVNIIAAAVKLLDNGGTEFLDHPDPLFAGRVSVVPDTLSLPARTERQVNISVRMPSGLQPNDYFLGFLVAPIINSSSVAVVNDIGALVILDIPGPRNRRLTAQILGLSWLNFSFSSSASGILRAKSIGVATLEFYTTIEITGWPAAKPDYLTVPGHLLPPGLYRDAPLHVSSFLGLGWYTFHATLVYDLSAQTTGEVALSRTVIVLNPLWLLVILALILLGLWIWRRKRRRNRKPDQRDRKLDQRDRKPGRRGSHRVTSSSPPAHKRSHASRS